LQTSFKKGNGREGHKCPWERSDMNNLKEAFDKLTARELRRFAEHVFVQKTKILCGRNAAYFFKDDAG